MDAPLIIAGDFNDWRRKADRMLQDELASYEVFEAAHGRPARTFPVGVARYSGSTASTRAGSTSSMPRVHYAFPWRGCPTTRRWPPRSPYRARADSMRGAA